MFNHIDLLLLLQFIGFQQQERGQLGWELLSCFLLTGRWLPKEFHLLRTNMIMKFPSEGKLTCCTQHGLNLDQFFDNIMPIFYFPLQDSKIFTDTSHVDVIKVKNCIIKVHLTPRNFFRLNKSLHLFETHCAFLN